MSGLRELLGSMLALLAAQCLPRRVQGLDPGPEMSMRGAEASGRGSPARFELAKLSAGAGCIHLEPFLGQFHPKLDIVSSR